VNNLGEMNIIFENESHNKGCFNQLKFTFYYVLLYSEDETIHIMYIIIYALLFHSYLSTELYYSYIYIGILHFNIYYLQSVMLIV